MNATQNVPVRIGIDIGVKKLGLLQPAHGFIWFTQEVMQGTHSHDLLRIVGVQFECSTEMFLGQIERSPKQVNPPHRELARAVEFIERDGLFRKPKRAVQPNVGPSHVAEPLKKHRMGLQCMRLPVFRVELDSPFEHSAPLGFRLEIPQRQGLAP